jgi:hypothetical protein
MMETNYVICEIQAEAKKKVYDPNITIKYDQLWT